LQGLFCAVGHDVAWWLAFARGCSKLSWRSSSLTGVDFKLRDWNEFERSLFDEESRHSATRQQHNLQQAKDSLIRARDAQKELYDRQRLPHDFAVGDLVYLDSRDLPITYANNTEERSRILQDRFAGLSEIVAASASPNAWVLNTPETWKVHQPFNVSRFNEYTSDRNRKQYPPAMVHTARGSEYMIEKIVAREKQGNRWMYRVRWTGYEEKDDTWQPLTDLDGCKETVEEFTVKKV
jgi:hypothetical protein